MDLKFQIQEIPISKIISSYILLSKKGLNFEGICPFHADTKPSIKINDVKGLFKCFACGAGGDAITFVMNYKDITFPEALRTIAQDQNLEMDAPLNQTKNKTQRPLELMDEVKKLFIEKAQSSSLFMDFLNQRKISPIIAKELELGFSSGRTIRTHIANNSKKLALALELGLITNEANGFEDTFKNRVMFPISDENGNCVGFCGRATDDGPKYMNSKSSFLFNKSELLYGLNYNKEAILKESTVLVVEGFMDVVSLYQHGIRNVVGCMGTALSTKNAQRLNELASEIILGLDTDKPGISAMNKIGANLLENGIVAYSISYAPYKDADEYLINEDSSSIKLKDLMNSSKTLIDDKLEVTIGIHRESSLEKKNRILKDIFKTLSPLGMELNATERIIESDQKLNLKTDTKFLLELYQKSL